MTVRRTARLMILCAAPAMAFVPADGQVGPPALDQLVANLDSDDAARRLEATGVLSSLGGIKEMFSSMAEKK